MEAQKSLLEYSVKLVSKHFKTYLYVFLLVSAASIATAYLLPVYYKSSAIFYPYASNSYDPRNFQEKKNESIYGNVTDIDRIITFLNSGIITDHVILKYDLIRRYDIDTTDKLYKVKMQKKFIENYSVNEDDRNAITITMYDKNPDTAAIIVNDILGKVDEYNRKAVKDNSYTQLLHEKQSLEERYKRLDSMNTAANKNKNITETNRSQYSLELLLCYSNLQEVENIINLYNYNYKTINIIEYASPILKKARPNRMLIVAGSIILSMLLLTLTLIIRDEIKENKS